MGKKQKVLITGTLLSFGVLFFMGLMGIAPVNPLSTTITGNTVANVDIMSDDFSKCLGERGVKVYSSENSESFQIQKKMFGESFGNIEYINCDINPEECGNILIMPTWIINGKAYNGAFSLEILSRITGCKL